MNHHTLSACIDIKQYLRAINPELKENLYKILDIIDSLYSSQKTSVNIRRVEDSLYKQIITCLKQCESFLDEEPATVHNSKIQEIENGIYDMACIKLLVSDNCTIHLLFGKIISASDSKRYYSGLVGIEDKKYVKIVADFKNKIHSKQQRIPLIEQSDIDNILNLPNSFTCLNAIRLAGYINEDYVPFSIFYSGGKREKLSSLSNTALLVNIYLQRFRLICEPVGNRIMNSRDIGDLSCDDTVAEVLVLWLWGHDMGHFLEADNLQIDNRKGYEYTYEVLHELRSDLFSLYLLKQILCDDQLITQQLMFQIYVFEMFRYMRKAEFENRPDSVSAYLIFRYMQIGGSINIDASENKVVFNYEKFGTLINNMLKEVNALFSQGVWSQVDEYLARLGIADDFKAIQGKMDIDLAFEDIPQIVKLK